MTGADKSAAEKTSSGKSAAAKAASDKAPGYVLSQSPSQMLHRAQQMAADAFARAYGKGDELTFRQFAVLAAVAETPGASQSDLVRATGIDRSTLADMIARMEKKNLLSRETSKSDGRAKSVKLTNKGGRKLADAMPIAALADAALLEALPKAKQKGFVEVLEALQAAAEAMMAEQLENGKEKKKKKDGKDGKGAKAKKRAKR